MADPRRILLADDEPVLTMILSKLLRSEGYATWTVNRSGEVLEDVRHFEPHAIILDIAMPGLGGHEVAAQIRADPKFEQVLIIALSGFGDSQAQESLEAGFDHHLVKPVEFNVLRQILETAFHDSGDRRAAIERLAEVNDLIEMILRAPENRMPGEYGALVTERLRLERKLKGR